jgi:cytochrome c oxidase subunit 1
MNDALGRIHFAGSLLFMNVIFMPMFIQGLAGVNRRLWDGGAMYVHAQETLSLNIPMAYAAVGLMVFQIPFVMNLAWSAWFGRAAAGNPWEATTLDWATPTPPPHGNFTQPPRVFRDPYEYSVPGAAADFLPQNAGS